MPNPQADDPNPYAPPTAALDRPESIGDPRAEALRRANLGHEAAFRALGMVHFACAAIDGLMVAIALYSTLAENGAMWSRMDPVTHVDWVAQSFVATPPLVVLHLLLGQGLRRLEPWAFRGQVILSGAVLVGFIATLSWELFGEFAPDLSVVSKFAFGVAHFAVLYYFLASRCRRIVAPDYREGVAATPSLKPRRSWAIPIAVFPFAIAFDWGVVVTAWKATLILAGVIGLRSQ